MCQTWGTFVGRDAIWEASNFAGLATWFIVLLLGLVTLDEMKAKREDLVREHEKQLAAKLKSEEPEG